MLLLWPLYFKKRHWLAGQAEDRRNQITLFAILFAILLVLLNSDIHLAMHHAMPLFVISSVLAGSVVAHWWRIGSLWLRMAIVLVALFDYGYLWEQHKQHHPLRTLQDHAVQAIINDED